MSETQCAQRMHQAVLGYTEDRALAKARLEIAQEKVDELTNLILKFNFLIDKTLDTIEEL